MDVRAARTAAEKVAENEQLARHSVYKPDIFGVECDAAAAALMTS